MNFDKDVLKKAHQLQQNVPLQCRMLIAEDDVPVSGQGIYNNSLYFLFNFSLNFKLLKKLLP